MRFVKSFLSYFFLSVLLVGSFACEDDSPNDPVSGDIIIVNEGNFGQGNGSVSLYNRITEEVNNNVFAEANAERALEASIQSITVAGNEAFIVCNASDKIEIVNAETFEALQAPLEDEGLISPRYLTVVGNKAYVSVWGPYDTTYTMLPDSKIAVIDLESFTVTKYIDTEDGAEDVQAIGDKVFVANSYTKKLTVIHTDTDEVEEVITLEGSPQWLEVHENDLWVSVTGAVSQFVRINPDDNSVEETVDVEGTNSNGKFTLNDALDMIYFIGAEPWPATETAIYALPLDDASASPEELISGQYFYAIGSDPLTHNLFVGNSNSFQGEGTVLQYDTEGNLLDTYAAGVGPSDFVF
jgi:DNA-binding beta-propeller fold protein YncE